ncbi:MAG TPA: hypothetical protein DDX72_10660 [Ruminococcaceae bacterium]|nr:hypothetical protein [Oscillospiraceae bacterium]
MDKRIRKRLIIEYAIKVSLPLLLYLLAHIVNITYIPGLSWLGLIYMLLVTYYWYILLAVFVLILFVPFTKREGSFFKKYIVPPLITLGIIGGIIGVIFGIKCAVQGVNDLSKYISDRQTGAEIDAFIDRSDETLVYIYPINGEEYYPNGIYYSSVKTSSVFIDYDTKEVAFVVYDWVYKDIFHTCKLEQTEFKTREFENYYDDTFEAPDIGDGYYYQTYTELNAPGQLLYTYGDYKRSGSTNGVALIMRDGTMWVAHFEPTDLSLGQDIFGFDLCHDGEQQKIEDQELEYTHQKWSEWNENSN